MQTLEQLNANMQEAILLDRLGNHIELTGWCLTELGELLGHNRRWIQRKLRGDTPLTLAEFFLICSTVDWLIEVRPVTK